MSFPVGLLFAMVAVMSALYLQPAGSIGHVKFKPSSRDSTKSWRHNSYCHAYLVFTVKKKKKKKKGRMKTWRTPMMKVRVEEEIRRGRQLTL